MTRPADWWVLDLAGDPAPGNPDRIRVLSARLATIGDEADAAGRQVRALASDSAVLTWIGAAGDAFRPAIGAFPGQLAKVAQSHHMAADALRSYATDLDSAQAQADHALAMGRTARDRLDTLRSQVSGAQSVLSASSSAAQQMQHPAVGVQPPDPAQVRAAVNNQLAAQQRVSQLSGQVSDAQSQLDIAKKLAGQAADLRSGAAGTCAAKINAASDAGIHPDSFWHKLAEIAGEVWHYTVIVAKIVVAVGGIIALIIGGPIAWIVFAAALIVLADTLYKYSQGKASLWDVALAVLSCIPMTKGITTFAKVAEAFSNGARDAGLLGGLLSAGLHIGGAFLKAGVETVRGLWQGARALPRLFEIAPYTALGKLTTMTAGLRAMSGETLTGFVTGLRGGDGIFGTVRGGASGLVDGWKSGAQAWSEAISGGDPALTATRWQSGFSYPGKDLWSNVTLGHGTQLEVLHPGISGFAVPDGTAASLGNDASAINQGIQVGGLNIDPVRGIAHNFRDSMLTLRLNADMPVAASITHANPQYGAGGVQQYFIPNIADSIKTGNISVLATDGKPLTVDIIDGPKGPFIDVRPTPDQVIQLHSLDLGPSSNVFTSTQFGPGVASLHHIGLVTTTGAREYQATR